MTATALPVMKNKLQTGFFQCHPSISNINQILDQFHAYSTPILEGMHETRASVSFGKFGRLINPRQLIMSASVLLLIIPVQLMIDLVLLIINPDQLIMVLLLQLITLLTMRTYILEHVRYEDETCVFGNQPPRMVPANCSNFTTKYWVCNTFKIDWKKLKKLKNGTRKRIFLMP